MIVFAYLCYSFLGLEIFLKIIFRLRIYIIPLRIIEVATITMISLWVCVCVLVSVCVSRIYFFVCVCMSVPVCRYVYVFFSLCSDCVGRCLVSVCVPCVCLCVGVCVCIFVCVSVCVCVCMYFFAFYRSLKFCPYFLINSG
jgi:hypothetical protein